MLSRFLHTVCLSLAGLSASRVEGFLIERRHLFGIWKLQLDPANALNTKNGKNILIKIQEDGFFQQCNDEEDFQGDKCLSGCWDFEDQQLKLAMDRTCSSCDVLLSGKVAEGKESGSKISIAEGLVSAGKFMYPQNHASFFENPMAAAEKTGKFSLKQILGFASFDPKISEPEKPPNKFKSSDFFYRKFFMTFVPIETKMKSQQEYDNEKGGYFSPLDNQPVDIRAMLVDFFPNGTFAAIGTNKILRGRFEVTEKDMLRFHVSRFGTGRSAPGSVYSEGEGLSHEGKNGICDYDVR